MGDSDFDKAAEKYDDTFTNSSIGMGQRRKVTSYLETIIKEKPLKVLELNCGTGEDAILLSQYSSSIVATDLSSKMLEVAKYKSDNVGAKIHFQELDLANPQINIYDFDLVFSNFGGLNCISKNQLISLEKFILNHTNKNAQCIFVVMPKNTILEYIYRKLKGKVQVYKSRSETKPTIVNVDGQDIKTFYFNTMDISLAFQNFKILNTKSIGFIPSFFEKSKWLPVLRVIEKTLNLFPVSPNKADHFLIHLKRLS